MQELPSCGTLTARRGETTRISRSQNKPSDLSEEFKKSARNIIPSGHPKEGCALSLTGFPWTMIAAITANCGVWTREYTTALEIEGVVRWV
jgi:hypothetical protein